MSDGHQQLSTRARETSTSSESSVHVVDDFTRILLPRILDIPLVQDCKYKKRRHQHARTLGTSAPHYTVLKDSAKTGTGRRRRLPFVKCTSMFRKPVSLTGTHKVREFDERGDVYTSARIHKSTRASEQDVNDLFILDLHRRHLKKTKTPPPLPNMHHTQLPPPPSTLQLPIYTDPVSTTRRHNSSEAQTRRSSARRWRSTSAPPLKMPRRSFPRSASSHSPSRRRRLGFRSTSPTVNPSCSTPPAKATTKSLYSPCGACRTCLDPPYTCVTPR